MPTMLETAVYRLTVQAVDDGQAIQNVFHYRITKHAGNPAPTSFINDLLTAFETAWHANVLPAMPASYKVLRYRCIEILGRTSNLLGAKHIYGEYDELRPTASRTAGSGVGNSCPGFVTAPITKVTGLVGKRNRGFWQFGPLLLTFVSDNELTVTGATTIGGLKDALTDLHVGLSPDDADLVLYHQREFIGDKFRAPIVLPGLSPVAATVDVSSTLTPVYVGSQKRRKLTRKFGV